MIRLQTIIVALSVVLFADWAQATAAENQAFVYPQERMYGVHRAVLYAPQI